MDNPLASRTTCVDSSRRWSDGSVESSLTPDPNLNPSPPDSPTATKAKLPPPPASSPCRAKPAAQKLPSGPCFATAESHANMAPASPRDPPPPAVPAAVAPPPPAVPAAAAGLAATHVIARAMFDRRTGGVNLPQHQTLTLTLTLTYPQPIPNLSLTLP
eukprot:scaffold28236_cov59-Phaeocystis_antarctica.AAC.5